MGVIGLRVAAEFLITCPHSDFYYLGKENQTLLGRVEKRGHVQLINEQKFRQKRVYFSI